MHYSPHSAREISTPPIRCQAVANHGHSARRISQCPPRRPESATSPSADPRPRIPLPRTWRSPGHCPRQPPATIAPRARAGPATGRAGSSPVPSRGRAGLRNQPHVGHFPLFVRGVLGQEQAAHVALAMSHQKPARWIEAARAAITRDDVGHLPHPAQSRAVLRADVGLLNHPGEPVLLLFAIRLEIDLGGRRAFWKCPGLTGHVEQVGVVLESGPRNSSKSSP